ncbi:MAG: succinylglutamate desuccinylase/aspartoacylase family protein [Saprospiraceae bacterium]|nr:succinylglutamate desuccinylase/aspartoacylase family protein [Saprospiraceae bacterium]
MIKRKKITIETKSPEKLIIDGHEIVPGQHNILRINAGKLPTDNRINVVAHVFSSGNPGPTVLLLGGVHGDEINGIEIVRRSIEETHFSDLRSGSLIIIPLLNVYGFINFSRDVSDGKDINRSFPGHLNGSLASRVARIITKKILPVTNLAVDFHTGGAARYNFPQVRFHHTDQFAEEMAIAFGAPVLLEQTFIPHSFRKAAHDMGVSSIVFEGGESVRLDRQSINTGVAGIRLLLSHLQMLENQIYLPAPLRWRVKKSAWIRASAAGIFIWHKKSGDIIVKGDFIGEIKDPYGTKSVNVLSSHSGLIIGHNNASVVNLGDALFHIGTEYIELQ